MDESSREDVSRMPVAAVLEKANSLQQGEIVELVSTFVPAPGIDLMKKKGFQVWCVRQGPSSIKTYFTKEVA